MEYVIEIQNVADFYHFYFFDNHLVIFTRLIFLLSFPSIEKLSEEETAG